LVPLFSGFLFFAICLLLTIVSFNPSKSPLAVWII
jgi:hypothetical protein